LKVPSNPFLETLKVRLDGAPSNLIPLKMPLLIAVGLDWMTSKGPFQLKLAYDSTVKVEYGCRFLSGEYSFLCGAVSVRHVHT